MNGNMNLGKRVTALEKDGGADIKKEISDLQVAVETVQNAVATAQNDIDALETKVNSGHVYGTVEKIVGTWIDGKPLYEQTFKKTVDVTGSTEYFSGIIVEDAESYFIEQAYCSENENGTGSIQLIGCTNTSGANDYNITSFNLKTGRWWVIRGSGTYPYTTIIVRYTKTTDSPTQ